MYEGEFGKVVILASSNDKVREHQIQLLIENLQKEGKEVVSLSVGLSNLLKINDVFLSKLIKCFHQEEIKKRVGASGELDYLLSCGVYVVVNVFTDYDTDRQEVFNVEEKTCPKHPELMFLNSGMKYILLCDVGHKGSIEDDNKKLLLITNLLCIFACYKGNIVKSTNDSRKTHSSILSIINS